MIRQKSRWMHYTWFNRRPGSSLGTTHLFSYEALKLPAMVRVPFPTMVIDLQDEQFVSGWSSSARNKINRATREQLSVDRGNYLITDILRLFTATAVLKGLRGYQASHFDQLPHVESSAIFYDGVMLCSHIWVVDDEEKRALLYVNASNHHNPNDDTSLTGRAHYFLLWQDGLYLRQKGVQIMDLMGFESGTQDPLLKGIYQWKAATHGKVEMLYHHYPVWFYTMRKLRKLLPL